MPMGKAAERRKARRQKYMKDLAASDPDKFRKELTKRVMSWQDQIHQRAGEDMLSKDSPSVFGIVDAAMETLRSCGRSTSAQYEAETYSVLSTECCIAINLPSLTRPGK